MNCVKFISKCGSLRFTEKCKISRFILQQSKFQFFCTSTSNKFHPLSEEDEFLKKIIYNEVLLNNPQIKPKRRQPICLKYLMSESAQTKEVKNEDVETEKEIVHFPYGIKESDESNVTETFIQTVKNFTPSDDETVEVPQWKPENYRITFRTVENPIRWAFEDVKELQNEVEFDDIFKFGSFNPNSSVSSVQCGGCGALLHCINPKMPGFIPAELFDVKNKTELLGEKCQRCHFLKQFNVALGVNVSPSEYENLISSIKDESALVIIMIDILDFPCSVFPRIFELIGPEKPVVIVVNKVDLLIQEGPQCLDNFKKSVMHSLKKQNINCKNIQHIELISAKTGYGIERLIDLLFANWGNKGDIYLVGCTNVGKSSLFNALIQSDLCKVKAVNLLQRATISAWPGTTLNLLKFPVMKPSEWRLILRAKRLENYFKEEAAFKKFQCLGQKIDLEQIPLQEYVGRTFLKEQLLESNEKNDQNRKGIDPNVQDFAKGHWFYDTPGVVHQDQIVNFLTAPELLLTVPKKMLLPRNFCLNPGTSLFIAGLARLDYISGGKFAWFTVYASMELPITVTEIKNAEEVYQNLLGTPYFRVPVSGKERLSKWPSLMSKKFSIAGRVPKFFSKSQLHNLGETKHVDVDIVLSSAGWVSVSLPLGFRCEIEAWTPKGKGIHLRDFPIIQRGNFFKGPRIPGTPAYAIKMKEVQKYSFTDVPST